MKYKKNIVLIIALLLLFNLTACSKPKEESELYLAYMVTTYSSGKEIETFEVYSNMEISANKNSITIYDSQGNILFYTILQYKVNSVSK